MALLGSHLQHSALGSLQSSLQFLHGHYASEYPLVWQFFKQLFRQQSPLSYPHLAWLFCVSHLMFPSQDSMHLVASNEPFYVSKYSGMILPSLSPLSTIYFFISGLLAYLWPTQERPDRGRPWCLDAMHSGSSTPSTSRSTISLVIAGYREYAYFSSLIIISLC